jgi:hypothetical protein
VNALTKMWRRKVKDARMMRTAVSFRIVRNDDITEWFIAVGFLRFNDSFLIEARVVNPV